MRKLSVALFLFTLAAAPLRGQHVASHVVATLSDSTFWPEGVDGDPRTGNLYVASVRHRTIAEIHRDGTSRELLPRDRDDLAPIFGVRVDTTRGVLWATMSGYGEVAGSDTTRAALLEIRTADGMIVHRWDIPHQPRGHVLGDLAIGPNGTVYFTDSVQPTLYVLGTGSDTIAAYHSALFRSLQGVAPSADGRSLYVADYSNGLLRVSLDDFAAEKIADPNAMSRGCDGIVLVGNAIIAVQNGRSPARIVRFELDPSGRRITQTSVIDENEAADEPTIGTLRDGEFVYVANSQWEKFDANGKRIPAHPLTPPLLLGIPLR